jgi:hypothetical protein
MLTVVTVYMGYRAREVELSYHFLNILPPDDPDVQNFNAFKQKFGEDAATVFVALNDKNLYAINNFNLWYDLSSDLKKIDGIVDVLSLSNLYNIKKNSSQKKFDIKPVLSKKPESQPELDEYIKQVHALPFYEGLIYPFKPGCPSTGQNYCGHLNLGLAKWDIQMLSSYNNNIGIASKHILKASGVGVIAAATTNMTTMAYLYFFLKT